MLASRSLKELKTAILDTSGSVSDEVMALFPVPEFAMSSKLQIDKLQRIEW